MEFLANLLSGFASLSTNEATIWMVFDEPECPEELT